MSDPAREPTDHADVVAMPPVIYLASIVLGVVARIVFGGAILPHSLPRLLAGAVLFVAGVAGGFVFVAVFRRTGQDRSPRTPTDTLSLDGPFRTTRNPAYVSLTVTQIGLAFLLDNPWLLAVLVPVLLLMHFGVVLREEAYLERKFGEEYLAYKRRVRRYL